MNKSISVDGISVEILRKDIKNLYIQVLPPDGKVVVKCPFSVGDDEIHRIVSENMRKIRRSIERISSRERPARKEYVSGEIHSLWGAPYRLEVVYSGKRAKVEKGFGTLVLTVPEGTDRDGREKTLSGFYRKELCAAIEPISRRCEERIGVSAKEWRTKNMITRWGTCNIRQRRIWLNLQLAKRPIEGLEYVIVHELVHLLEKNHTKRFWSLVEKYYPNYIETKNLLNSVPLDK